MFEKKPYLDLLKKRAQEKKEKGIHSYTHSIVKEVCEYFGNMKEFGLWLGIAKRVGAGELKAKLDQVKEKGIKDPKYLMGCVRKKQTT